MDQTERRRDREVDIRHRACTAVISLGVYGEWHLCEVCEMAGRTPHAAPAKAERVFAS